MVKYLIWQCIYYLPNLPNVNITHTGARAHAHTWERLGRLGTARQPSGDEGLSLPNLT